MSKTQTAGNAKQIRTSWPAQVFASLYKLTKPDANMCSFLKYVFVKKQRTQRT